MNKRGLSDRVRNSPREVRYSDFRVLVEAVGSTRQGTRGRHRVYRHPSAPERLNAAG